MKVLALNVNRIRTAFFEEKRSEGIPEKDIPALWVAFINRAML